MLMIKGSEGLKMLKHGIPYAATLILTVIDLIFVLSVRITQVLPV